jgi:hypothetical protein
MLIYLLQGLITEAVIKTAIRNFMKKLASELMEDAKEGYTGKVLNITVNPGSKVFCKQLTEALNREGINIVNSEEMRFYNETKFKIAISWNVEGKKIEYANSNFYHISLNEY